MNTPNIFTINNLEDYDERLNIDDLYEAHRQRNIEELKLFNKILSRVHTRIKLVSRMRENNQSCWFYIPEVIIGVARFNSAECVAYIVSKLTENGFRVKYFHPNTLFIAWNHWVPTYARDELRKKYGVNVNEYGEEIADPDASNGGPKSLKSILKGGGSTGTGRQKRHAFVSTKSFRPDLALFNTNVGVSERGNK